LKLGVIACLHGNLAKARKFATYLRKNNVDAVALVGDIGTDEKQKQSLVKIISIFAKLNKKIFVTPGNHEQLRAYYSALKKFKKNKNIVDCTKNPKIEFCGQKFVFWPGSGMAHAPGAGFFLMGNKWHAKQLIRKIKLRKEHFFNPVKFFNFRDLTRHLDKNTVVVTHSPTKFSANNAIDVAVFGRPSRAFSPSKKDRKLDKTTNMYVFTPQNSIFPLAEAKKFIKHGYPVKILKANVGNNYYRKILKKYKISKFICGDIHEAGGRANDWKGKQIKQNKWSKELFYNCAAGKEGRAGIVEFLNGKARYKVVKV